MQIQINTDNNIEGDEDIASEIRNTVETILSRFNEQITRIEVHVSDENSSKAGIDDKRCLIEARIEGRQPVAVTHQAAHIRQAVQGATEKLKHRIESLLSSRDNY